MNLHLMNLEASYDQFTGALDRVVFKWLVLPERPEVAYIATIEPNDDRPHPTEMSVKRRLFIGPRITDVETTRLSDRDKAFKTEAAAIAEIEQLILADLKVRTVVVEDRRRRAPA